MKISKELEAKQFSEWTKEEIKELLNACGWELRAMFVLDLKEGVYWNEPNSIISIPMDKVLSFESNQMQWTSSDEDVDRTFDEADWLDLLEHLDIAEGPGDTISRSSFEHRTYDVQFEEMEK